MNARSPHRRTRRKDYNKEASLLLLGLLLHLLDVKPWWKTLLEFLCLLWIIDRKSVKVPRASNLKLCALFCSGLRGRNLFDARRAGVLPPCDLNKLLDIEEVKKQPKKK